MKLHYSEVSNTILDVKVDKTDRDWETKAFIEEP